MSDYGLKTVNATGKVQIDSIYRNLSLYEASSYIMPYVMIPNSFSIGFKNDFRMDTPPLTAFKPVTNAYCMCHGPTYIPQEVNPTNYGFSGSAFYVERGHMLTIEYAIFYEDPNPSFENYGLRVYNSAGRLCFDSGKHYLKIKEVHTVNINPTSGSTVISHPTITDPYYMYFSNSVYSTGNNIWFEGLRKLSSTSVSAAWFLSTDQLGVGLNVNTPSTLFVCDFNR